MSCEWLINGTQGGGVSCCISAQYFASNGYADILFNKVQPHPGVIIIYELAD